MTEDFLKTGAKKERVYLAGPMTGYKDYNFPAFMNAAEKLRAKGYDVVNPAEIEAAETGPRQSWEYYLRRDIRELVTCDSLAVLSGWGDSNGANLEIAVAAALGMEVWMADFDEREPVMAGLIPRIRRSMCNPIKDIAQKNNAIFPAGTTNSEAFVEAFTKKEPSYEASRYQERKLKIGTQDPKVHPDYLPPDKVYKKETVLEEAGRIVGGDRAASYGHPRQDFERTAMIWSAILGTKVTDMQVAMCMIGVKVSRQCNANKRDNLTDIAGYARTAEMVADSHAEEDQNAVH